MRQEEIVDPKAYAHYLASALKLVKAKGEKDDEGDAAPLNFALAFGAKPEQHRLGLSKTEQGRAMATHLVQWTRLKDFTYGTAFFSTDNKTTLALELERNAPTGAKKKAQALLKHFSAPRFSKVALFVEGEELAEDSDDDREQDRLGDDSGEGSDDELLESKDVPDTESEDVEPEETADPEKLKAALEKLKPALMKAIQTHPELRDQLMAPITAFAGQMKIEQYEGAKTSLERAMRQVQAVLSAPGPKPTPQVDQDTPQQKKDFDAALRQLALLLRIANGINATTPEMQDLKNRLLKAEEGMKAAAGRTDYETALKFAQALQIVAQKLMQVHNTAETAQRELVRQHDNKGALNGLIAGLDGSFDGIQPQDISNRYYDGEAKQIFPRGGAQVYRDQGLKPGQEFQDLLNRLNEFENVMTPENANDLEAAIDAYVTHFNSLNLVRRSTKESKRKKEIADDLKAKVAQYRQLMQEKARQTDQRKELALKNDYEASKGVIQQAGDPPWDPGTESKVRSEHAKLTMLSARRIGGPDSSWQGARDLEATGDSQSFWIGTPRPGGKKAKKFFFKPLESEDRKYGMPQGGMATREMVSGTVVNRLSEKTGIEFGLPPITPVVLPNRYLKHEGDGPAPNPDAPSFGSMQDFVDAPRGQLGSRENRANIDQIAPTIPKEEVQKVALMDMILLNTDRNALNLLLGGPEDTPPTLVPIDQGLCLPTLKVLKARGASMANAGNALLTLPGANEKLSDDMQAKLALITPEDIAQSVTAGRNTMRSTGQQNVDSLLDDDSVKLSQRALAFVKRAAPHLTVKEIFDALGKDTATIFEGPEEDMEAAFNRAIAAAPGRVKALEEINTPPWSPQTVVAELQKLGWGYGLFGQALQSTVEREAESWLKIVKAGTVNPMLQSMIDEELNDLGNPPGLTDRIKDMPLPEAYQAVLDEKDRVAGIRPNLEKALVALGNPPQLMARIKDMAIPEAMREANTALRDETQRGLAQLGNPQDLAGQIGGQTPLAAYTTVQRALGRTVATPDSREAKAQAYQEAGGDAVFDELAESLPDKLLLDDKTDAIRDMRAWPKYVELGGDDAFYAAGGNDQFNSIPDRIAYIKSRGNHRAGFALLEQEKGFDKRIEEKAMKDLEAVTGRVMAVRDVQLRGRLRGKLSAIQELTDSDKYEEAVPLLRDLAQELDKAGV